MEYLDLFRKQHLADEEEFVLYSIPHFRLFGAVNPEKTEVRCNAGGVTNAIHPFILCFCLGEIISQHALATLPGLRNCEEFKRKNVRY